MTNKQFITNIALGCALLSCTLQAATDPFAFGPQVSGINPQVGKVGASSDEEMFFNQLMTELDQMPPEELKKFEQQLQDQIKQEYNQMSDEERQKWKADMDAFWNAQGVDPKTLPSLEEMIGLAPSQEGVQAPPAIDVETSTPEALEILPKIEPTAQIAPTELLTIHKPTEVARLLDRLIHLLELIRKNSATHPHAFKGLSAWKESIDDLVYDLLIINKTPHHSRLGTREFQSLFSTLEQLLDALIGTAPLITFREVATQDNPYVILNVASTASDKAIKKVYEEYVAKYDSDKLRAELKAEGLSDNDIEGQVRQAKLALRTIQEAYDKINEPKIRKQTDRQLAISQEQVAITTQEAQQAIDRIKQSLDRALYQKDLLGQLSQFMQKYDPIAFAEREKMLKAEAARRKEQEMESQLRPTQTPGSFAPHYPPGHGFAPQPSGFDGQPPFFPDWLRSGTDHPQPAVSAEPTKEARQKAGTPAAKPEAKKEEKKPTAPAKPAPIAKEDPVHKAFDAFMKQLEELQSAIKKITQQEKKAGIPEKNTMLAHVKQLNKLEDEREKLTTQLEPQQQEVKDQLKQLESMRQPTQEELDKTRSELNKIENTMKNIASEIQTIEADNPEAPELDPLREQFEQLNKGVFTQFKEQENGIKNTLRNILQQESELKLRYNAQKDRLIEKEQAVAQQAQASYAQLMKLASELPKLEVANKAAQGLAEALKKSIKSKQYISDAEALLLVLNSPQDRPEAAFSLLKAVDTAQQYIPTTPASQPVQIENLRKLNDTLTTIKEQLEEMRRFVEAANKAAYRKQLMQQASVAQLPPEQISEDFEKANLSPEQQKQLEQLTRASRSQESVPQSSTARGER